MQKTAIKKRVLACLRIGENEVRIGLSGGLLRAFP